MFCPEYLPISLRKSYAVDISKVISFQWTFIFFYILNYEKFPWGKSELWLTRGIPSGQIQQPTNTWMWIFMTSREISHNTLHSDSAITQVVHILGKKIVKNELSNGHVSWTCANVFAIWNINAALRISINLFLHVKVYILNQTVFLHSLLYSLYVHWRF